MEMLEIIIPIYIILTLFAPVNKFVNSPDVNKCAFVYVNNERGIKCSVHHNKLFIYALIHTSRCVFSAVVFIFLSL